MNATVTKSTRGRKPLNVKLPQGAFTIGQFFGMNDKAKGGVMKCELTARNHVKRGVNTGLFVKLPEKATTGKVGAPALRFILKARNDRNLARRKATVKATEPAPAVV